VDVINQMKAVVLILLFFLLSAAPSFAQVYKWVDEKGGVHFTDDFAQVPEKNRGRVERLGTLEEGVNAKSENEPASKKKVEETRPREDPYRDQTGRGEAYWKGRVEESMKKLKGAQEKLNDLRVKYNDLTEKFNQSKNQAERNSLRKERDQIKAEIDRYRAEVEEAKNMLDKKIPEEAEMFKAKPEWIKQ
jgi:hypothetical protein